MSDLTFLHITDCHLSNSETVSTIDVKLKGGGVTKPLRSDVLRNTLESVRDILLKDGKTLSALIFSGDGTFKGDKTGQKMLRNMLLDVLKPVGITTANIVATPGNHDIVAGSPDGTKKRYTLFSNAWIGREPVIVPFLDGVHKRDTLCLEEHVLRDPDGEWAIFPINSSNWSQIQVDPKDNVNVSLVKQFINKHKNPEVLCAFDALCRYDVARISEQQLQVIRELVNQTGDVKIKIAVLHHHLLPVNGQEEFKPFADITNLGQLRQVLRELGFSIVVHGHKHTKAVFYDYISPENDVNSSPHRMLAISGGTFGSGSSINEGAAQLITVSDLPYAPQCSVASIGVATPGRDAATRKPNIYPLWEYDYKEIGPVVIAGKSIDEVYRRILQTVNKHQDRTMVCTIDLPEDVEVPFPITYTSAGNKDELELGTWFKETVMWWQLEASRIEARIPYIHGSRLRRYGGSQNQIKRVVNLLKGGNNTSKAIAFVVDPSRDFGDGVAFASFCLVQFCLRPGNYLDCVGYFRTQEFSSWWPVNVAELRHLQVEVAKELTVKRGKITTITPYPRLSENVRAPTKVAVPLIDQWQDNHPDRIAKIALALSGRVIDTLDGIEYWHRCLDDLEQGVVHHRDGVPVAIDGLFLLIQWLNATNASNEIISKIQQLHDTNEAHQKNETDDAFKRWERVVLPLIKELRKYPIASVADCTEDGARIA